MTIKTPKKLIEVALPLDKINEAAAREKSIRHGHPSTLHLWWARRPLAAARAVIFAQMVNDPGFQTGGGFRYGMNKAEAAKERQRLFRIMEKLVLWENTTNEDVLEEARAEIRRSWREVCDLNTNHPQAAELFNPDQLPAFHDPFAGGGALPLEAQRLGLTAYASDLNPVAVTINKAMIEIPPKFAGREPVGPLPKGERKKECRTWPGATGLAEDVRRYGAWMRTEAEKRIGHLYPPVEITEAMAKDRPDLGPLVGHKLTVIAWIWARTVKSPNPAFNHVHVPLASTFVLSSKTGKEAYVQPVVEGDQYRFEVKMGEWPEGAKEGTKLSRGANFRCLMSGIPIESKHIYSEANAGRMGARLMAIVAEGSRGRIYLAPTDLHESIIEQAQPEWKPEVAMPDNPRWFSPPLYGLKSYGDLFTPRQLVALTTFSDLVQEARAKVLADALGARASRPHISSGQDGRAPRNAHENQWHSRGYLPHWEAGEIPQAITFRLHDSLPLQIRELWREELANLPEEERTRERRKRIESTLDSGHGSCALRDPRVAEMVENALLHFDGERYRIHAWAIMPNHVHVLASPLQGHTLSSILHSWKSFTAKQVGKIMGTSGAFWMEEYFDRAIRNDEHFANAVRYIEENPVKAGLCAAPSEWRWSSAWNERTRHYDNTHPGSAAILAAGKEERAGRPRSQDEDDGQGLDAGGTGAAAYADAVAVYLGFLVDQVANHASTICGWNNPNTQMRSVFARQALPMTWDYAEANVFSNSTGSYNNLFERQIKGFDSLGLGNPGLAIQADATSQTISNSKIISSDPPYYDNIGYADLSDFFYVWLRKSLKSIFPGLYSTIAVPKSEELVATPYRHGGKEEAETFFLNGMTRAIHNLAKQAHQAYPVTIYYAFKQAETKGDTATHSTGWETFLAAVGAAGFAITGTWPLRTEKEGRVIGNGTNALASSIVLVCRKRPADALTISRREFIRELNAVLPEALDEMTRGTGADSPVAPVDLSQAIIGPGMAIFSKYAAVLEADGSPMTVRTALQLINRFLAEDDFDHDTQFCLHWFEQYGWNPGEFGQADTLSRAKGTSVDGIREAGVLESGGGKVRLYRWAEYPADWNPANDSRLPVWEALHQMIRVLRHHGEGQAGRLLAAVRQHSDAIRQLAYRLYTLCERKGWAEDARAYNELITSWDNIDKAASKTTGERQRNLPGL